MKKSAAVWSILWLGVAGCSFLIQGHAEMVKRDKGGGVLALKGDRDKAMEDAKHQMASNCPSGYEITGEEMAKVGETTEGAEDTEFKKKGASKNTSSVTQDLKEYRITYACKSSE
jgi:hypothetical protein